MYLSKSNLESTAARVIRAYKKYIGCDGPLENVDITKLVHGMLGLKIEYRHLSRTGTRLGATSFQYAQLRILNAGKDESLIYELDGKTILVEADLNTESKIGRHNFTVSHEGCHHILNMLYPDSYVNCPQMRAVHFYEAQTANRSDATDWVEWRTNVLASAILLPAESVKLNMDVYGLGDKLHLLNSVYAPKEYRKFCSVARNMGVSKQALAIRMQGLGLLDLNYLSNPYSLGEVLYDDWEVDNYA